jgi:hypothetical protein
MPSTLRVAIRQVAPDSRLTDAADAARAGAALASLRHGCPAIPHGWMLPRCGACNHAPVKAVFRRMANESVVVDGAPTCAAAIAARCHRAVVGVTERCRARPRARRLFNALLTSGPDGRPQPPLRFSLPLYGAPRVGGTGRGCGPSTFHTQRVRASWGLCWSTDAAGPSGTP